MEQVTVAIAYHSGHGHTERRRELPAATITR
jgi:hypothetical protein